MTLRIFQKDRIQWGCTSETKMAAGKMLKTFQTPLMFKPRLPNKTQNGTNSIKMKTTKRVLNLFSLKTTITILKTCQIILIHSPLYRPKIIRTIAMIFQRDKLHLAWTLSRPKSCIHLKMVDTKNIKVVSLTKVIQDQETLMISFMNITQSASRICWHRNNPFKPIMKNLWDFHQEKFQRIKVVSHGRKTQDQETLTTLTIGSAQSAGTAWYRERPIQTIMTNQLDFHQESFQKTKVVSDTRNIQDQETLMTFFMNSTQPATQTWRRRNTPFQPIMTTEKLSHGSSIQDLETLTASIILSAHTTGTKWHNTIKSCTSQSIINLLDTDRSSKWVTKTMKPLTTPTSFLWDTLCSTMSKTPMMSSSVSTQSLMTIITQLSGTKWLTRKLLSSSNKWKSRITKKKLWHRPRRQPKCTLSKWQKTLDKSSKDNRCWPIRWSTKLSKKQSLR